MRIADILNRSQHLVTISKHSTVQRAIALLAEHRIGVLPVMDQQDRFLGLVSERDIILGFAQRGRDLLGLEIGVLLSHEFPIAHEFNTVVDVMHAMTDERVRHMPILRDDRLIGIVSIGDILKSRLSEKTEENAVLQDIARFRLAAAA